MQLRTPSILTTLASSCVTNWIPLGQGIVWLCYQILSRFPKGSGHETNVALHDTIVNYYTLDFKVLCSNFIGASLSKPHTSTTTLCTCMCTLVWMLVAIYLKWGHLNFNITKIELGVWSLKARVQRRLPRVEMTEVEVEAHMATYSLFATDHRRRLPEGSTSSITMVVEVASGKGHA